MCITCMCVYIYIYIYIYRHLFGTYLKLESMSHCHAYVQKQSILPEFSKMGVLNYILNNNVSLLCNLAKSL